MNLILYPLPIYHTKNQVERQVAVEREGLMRLIRDMKRYKRLLSVRQIDFAEPFAWIPYMNAANVAEMFS